MPKLYKTIRAELLPCANCGGAAELTRGVTGMHAVVCPCGSHIFYGAEWSAEKTTAAWNTRAERTCRKVIPNEMEGYVFCSGCGAEIGEYGYPNYCHNCGAKVVSE